MASHAYITPNLLPATNSERLGLLGTLRSRRSLLPAGPGIAPGPVSLAIRTVRSASKIDLWQSGHDDERRAIEALGARIAAGGAL